jgi:hypothetical protein
MKITIEFNDVAEYLEFKEKTAQEGQVQEQFLDINDLTEKLYNSLK